MPPLKIMFILTVCVLGQVKAFEPFSAGFAIGAAFLGSALYAGWDHMKCNFYECCDKPWITPDMSVLRKSLERNLFGQHLVISELIPTLTGFLRDRRPQKALAISFHGWTGGGKNYVAKFIAESMYKKGLKSKHVHLFISTVDFPHASEADRYKRHLLRMISSSVRECERSLFIFDEVDKMPAGVLESIKPFLDYHDSISGIDFRKSIFLFLSNTGGREITKKAFEFWKAGLEREHITYKHLEELIVNGAYNEKGGFQHSSLLDKSLIDIYIPFLPLERKHVKMCAALEIRKYGMTPSEENTNIIADELTYWPANTKLYSSTGCKRVVQKVQRMKVNMHYDHIFDN